ncbi:MAG TPA: hypothetical protein PKN50_18880 [Spirochaetota bacterium]|nr:hypothetical protein [Spirochaetota bacterium]HPV40040.1 hypothetical protein [Spirochaetota bacterium]
MIDIMEIEGAVLIEADDFGLNVGNLVTEIQFRDKKLGHGDACRFACAVIGSLVEEGLITVIKTEYVMKDEDFYVPVVSREVSKEELNGFIRNPDKWVEMKVFSDTFPFELRTTEKGREKLKKLKGG